MWKYHMLFEKQPSGDVLHRYFTIVHATSSPFFIMYMGLNGLRNTNDANLFVHKHWLKTGRDEVVCVTFACVCKLLLWLSGHWCDVLNSIGGDEVLVGLQAHQGAILSVWNWWSPPLIIRVLELLLCVCTKIPSNELLSSVTPSRFHQMSYSGIPFRSHQMITQL